MLSKEEKRFLSAIDTEEAWGHVEYLSTLDKTTGTEGERRAHAYVRERLDRYGVPFKAYEFDALISHPKEASLKVVSPSPLKVDCITHAFAASTPEQGIEGELIEIPASTADIHSDIERLTEEYREIGVEGKIAILWGVARPDTVWAAQQAGALAQVHICGGEALQEMIVTSVWGTPTPESAWRIPRISVLSVMKAAGENLLKLLQKGTVKVRVMAKVETRWRKSPLTVAEIAGREEPERFMLLHGHMDSWYTGATDNCTGNAALLELARLLANHRGELKRSVRIAWWSGHSTGRYSSSAWYADNHHEDLYRNCFLGQNVDSPGIKGATDLSGGGLMGTMEFIRRAQMDATGSEKAKPNPFYVRGADQSFYSIGIPSVAVRAYIPEGDPLRGRWIGGSGGGWWWHTAYDTLEKADRDNLRRDIGMVGLVVFRSVNSTILPFDFAQVAEQFRTTMKEIQTRTASGTFSLNSTLDKIMDLKAGSEALNAKIAGLKKAEKAKVFELNGLLMETSRILTSTFYTYGRQHEHDPAWDFPRLPAFQDAARLARLDPESDDARFLRTKMLREMNRVNHQLDSAAAKIGAAINLIG